VGGAEALLAALERGLDALGTGARDLPDRHRGLRAALNWTVALLEDEHRSLFEGLAAFADAWTIEQVDALFGPELDTWNALAALIDFSLIRRRGDGRMTMVEHVRAYALELLAASGREHECRRRHAELMAETLEALDQELALDTPAVTARTREVIDEAELAIAWARGAEPALHRRLVAAAGRPFYLLGRLFAFRDDLEALIAVDDRSDAISGRLLHSYGGMLGVGSNMVPTVPWVAAAVECHRRTGTRLELLTTLTTHAWILMAAERPAEARAVVAEALELAAEQPDPRHRDQLEGTLAHIAIVEGNLDEAEARLAEITSRPERTDFAAAGAVSAWGECALGRHDYDEALPRTVAALQQSGSVYDTIGQLTVVAAALAGQGRDHEAAELMGAADRAAREVGMGERAPAGWSLVDEPLAAAAARVGEAKWERMRAHGGRMSLEHAIDWAGKLGTPEPVEHGNLE
jgi:hypothetical protein